MSHSPKPATINVYDKEQDIDERLRRLRDHTLPDVPYLMDLTTPTRFILAPHQIDDWRRGYPFTSNEEKLQYMSFHSHTLRGDTILRTSGDWDSVNGMADPARFASTGSSGSGSPLPNQPPRKKISLLDYRNKTAGQASAKPSPTNVNGHVNAVPIAPRSIEANKKTITRDEPAKATKEQNAKPEPPSKEHPHGIKRPAEAMADSADAEAFDAPSASLSSKRVHMTVELNTKDKAAKKINDNRPRLPRLLSPTLPPSIEEQLAKLRDRNAQSTHRASPIISSGSDKKAHINGSSLPGSHKSRRSLQKEPDVPEIIEKISPEVKPSPTSHTPQVKAGPPQVKQLKVGGGPGTKIDANTRQGKGSSISSSNNPANGSQKENKERPAIAPSSKSNQDNVKKRLVVNLKIPKHLRTNCKRILQMQPRPRKFPINSQPQSSSSPRDPPRKPPASNSNTTPQAAKTRVVSNQDIRKKIETVGKQPLPVNSPATPKSGEKRRRAEEERDLLQPSVKHHKSQAIELSSRPHTPVTSATKSPNLSHHGGSQKTQLSTPKQTLKSAAMNRVGSTDEDVHTAQGLARGSSTPTAHGSSEASNSEGRSSSNVSATSNPHHNSRSDEGLFFKTEFKRYFDIAKTLKHEADPLTKLGDGQYNPDPTVRKQGLAIAIEAMLCFILAFSLNDESARLMRASIDRAGWNTLFPYSRFLRNLAAYGEETDHLAGFLCQLEAFCRDTVLTYDLDHLERIAGASNEQRAEISTLTRRMAENSRLAKQSWFQGYDMLGYDTLEQHYPNTWSKRMESPVGRLGYMHISPQQNGDGSGPPRRFFFLPLNTTSDGLEVAWAGLSFLEEWCSKEGIEWKSKIN